MKYTDNLKLNKPEAAEFVNIEDINANMDILDALFTIHTVTLPAGGWSAEAPYTQTVVLEGMTAAAYPQWYISGTPTEAEFEAFSMISTMETGNGTVTFTAVSDKPGTDVTIMIK